MASQSPMELCKSGSDSPRFFVLGIVKTRAVQGRLANRPYDSMFWPRYCAGVEICRPSIIGVKTPLYRSVNEVLTVSYQTT